MLMVTYFIDSLHLCWIQILLPGLSLFVSLLHFYLCGCPIRRHPRHRRVPPAHAPHLRRRMCPAYRLGLYGPPPSSDFGYPHRQLSHHLVHHLSALSALLLPGTLDGTPDPEIGTHGSLQLMQKSGPPCSCQPGSPLFSY